MTDINVYKSYYGNTADNTFPFDDGKAIRISTVKASNGKIVASATVVTPTDSGFIYKVFDDFYYNPISVAGRATKKAIFDVQAAAIDMLDEIKAKARAFYAAKESYS